MPLVDGPDAPPGAVIELLCGGNCAQPLRLDQDRARQWVIRAGFHDPRPGQQAPLVGVPFPARLACESRQARRDRDHIRHLWLAVRQRTGLIKRQGRDPPGVFQVLTALDQDAGLGRPANPCYHRDRGGDDQRPRAADHQQGQRQLDVARQRIHHQAQPDDEGRIPLGKTLDKALGGRFLVLGFFHPADDARQGRIGAHPGGLHLEQTVLIDRPGKHAVAAGLLLRHRLAGDGAFIHRRTAFDHTAVHRDLRPRFHQHHFARLDFVRRQLHLPLVTHHDGGDGGQVQQSFEHLARLAERARFQVGAQDEQERHGCRLPVFTDCQRPQGGNRHQQLDADMPVAQAGQGPHGNIPTRHDRRRRHRQVVHQLAASQLLGPQGQQDQPAAGQGQQFSALLQVVHRRSELVHPLPRFFLPKMPLRWLHSQPT